MCSDVLKSHTYVEMNLYYINIGAFYFDIQKLFNCYAVYSSLSECSNYETLLLGFWHILGPRWGWGTCFRISFFDCTLNFPVAYRPLLSFSACLNNGVPYVSVLIVTMATQKQSSHPHRIVGSVSLEMLLLPESRVVCINILLSLFEVLSHFVSKWNQAVASALRHVV